jgi:CRP/FNR family transcriptional regulator
MGTDNVVHIEQSDGSCDECSHQQVCLTRGWVPDEIKKLEPNVRRGKPLPRGELLYRQGERLRALYILRSGALKSFLSTADGLEQVVRFHLPGAILGLDGLGDDHYASSAQAIVASSVCRLPSELINSSIEKFPVLRMRILRLAGREAALGHERAILLTQRAAEERLASFLIEMSEQYGQRGFSPREFNLPMSRQDISSYLSLAVETVSRMFTGFQNAGLIEVDRRSVRLLDMGELRAMAHGGRLAAAN